MLQRNTCLHLFWTSHQFWLQSWALQFILDKTTTTQCLFWSFLSQQMLSHKVVVKVWQVTWQLSKLCWWRPCGAAESSRMWTLCGDGFVSFPVLQPSSGPLQMFARLLGFPNMLPVSATKTQTGLLQDRSTGGHTQSKHCCCCCWHTQHRQQRKRPLTEYKSWQFGNWAFGLMESPKQHPEPDDRKRDLNKQAGYWGERRCQGNITVKM